MRPTEPAAPRPAVRAFTTRELLLTTWNQRRQLAPAEQVKLDHDRLSLEISARNAGLSFGQLAILSAENAKQGKPASDDDALLELVAPRPRPVHVPRPH